MKFKEKIVRGKRGQMIYYIIAIVILLASFLIVLLFYSRLNPAKISNDEICYNSILLQAKSAHLAPGGLQCKTDYVCISGGGKCSSMNPTETVNVNPTDKQGIMKAIADQMASCWSTFGAGQLDYKGTFGSVCAVCAVIGFDNTIQNFYTGTENPQSYSGFASYNDCVKALGYGSQVCSTMFPNGQGSSNTPANELTYKDLLNYLATYTTTQGSGNETYLLYLYGDYNLSYLLSESPTVNQFYNSGIISPSNSYNVITEESKGIITVLNKKSLSGANYLPPILLQTEDVSKYLGSTCGFFLTQA